MPYSFKTVVGSLAIPQRQQDRHRQTHGRTIRAVQHGVFLLCLQVTDDAQDSVPTTDSSSVLGTR
jgi:hypothetical protein